MRDQGAQRQPFVLTIIIVLTTLPSPKSNKSMDFGYQRRCLWLTGAVLVLQVQLILVATLAKSHVPFSSFNNITTTSSSLLRGRELLGCNLYKGKWVVDNSYPLYAASNCPYIDSGYDCLKHGRSDTRYLKYAWQPDSCNLPRFNGLDLLSKWRGKKVMFVGDSLSENMWQSLACLLHASAPKSKTSFQHKDSLTSLTFQSLIHSFNVAVLGHIRNVQRWRLTIHYRIGSSINKRMKVYVIPIFSQ
nr:protein trichome birefringence-like 38 [Tanacetum cinerariifolium]